MNTVSSSSGSSFDFKALGTNVLAGLTVSFVAISLGAAFGLASGRKDGAFVGILSAGVIALITALFGGTRIQCSGPTAPMTAVTAAIVLAVTTGPTAAQLANLGIDPALFVNQVFILCGVLLIVGGVLRAAKLISFVPKVVISGFMNGIAVLIWVAEFGKLFGLLGHKPIGGEMSLNVAIAVGTCFLCFVATPLVQGWLPKFLHFLPGALIAIIVATALVTIFGISREQVAFIELVPVHSFQQIADLFSGQMPTRWSVDVLMLALPFAANLAFLCYLDTLLTALVVDKMATRLFKREEKTKMGKELVAQGIANSVVSLFGGIPGAQATIRSVLILNEGATMRFAGVTVGLFVVVEMLLLQDMLELIPQAIFTGVLFKVGYDVMDWDPIIAWVKRVTGKTPAFPIRHGQMAFIVAVTVVTVMVNLNVAVIGFTVLFIVLSKTKYKVPDLMADTEFHDGAEVDLETGTMPDELAAEDAAHDAELQAKATAAKKLRDESDAAEKALYDDDKKDEN